MNNVNVIFIRVLIFQRYVLKDYRWNDFEICFKVIWDEGSGRGREIQGRTGNVIMAGGAGDGTMGGRYYAILFFFFPVNIGISQ